MEPWHVSHGSTFTFSLKLADLQAEEEIDVYNSFEQLALQSMPIHEEISAGLEKIEISSAAKQTNSIEMNGERPLMLIVDDDPVNLQVLEAILTPDEYEVTMVTSGKEALAVLDTKDWDLVISDVMMPQMSGYELTRLIREWFTLTELPVLLLTARSQPKDIQRFFFIEKVRFDERLEVVWELDDYEELKIPFLSIQPLVENAIKHGIMKRTRGGKIVIRISVYETHAEITVEDDGDLTYLCRPIVQKARLPINYGSAALPRY